MEVIMLTITKNKQGHGIKQSIAVLLVLALMFSFIPSQAFADENNVLESSALHSKAMLSVWTSAGKEIKIVENGIINPDTQVSDGKGGTASYDADTNTLTLNKFKGYSVYASAMGTFTMHIKGECSLNGDSALTCALAFWLANSDNGNLTISADKGSNLTLSGPDAHGMYINCQSANIEKNVTIDINAAGAGDRALVISETPNMKLAGKIKAIGKQYGASLDYSKVTVTGLLEVGNINAGGSAMLLEKGSKLIIDKGDFKLGKGNVSKNGSEFILIDSTGKSKPWTSGNFSGSATPNKVLQGWQKISGKWYYYNSKGVVQTGWQYLSGNWYYLHTSSGAMLSGWQYLSGNWYYLHTSSGAMQTGWQYLSGNWYYLHTSSGIMLTGTHKIGAKKYKFNSAGIWIK
jgi:hypothetical protein